MKKDLLAAFTFILTGVLFYTIGHSAEAKDLSSTSLGCDESPAMVVVDDGAVDPPAEISFSDEGRLDS